MKNGKFGGIKQMNNFYKDLEWSMDAKEDEMFNLFYKKVFPNIKEIEFCKDMGRQRKGIDKIIHFKNGKEISIDEKKRRVDYGDILLEIWSVDNKKRGWLYTCQCDYIVYAIIPKKTIYLLPTLLLKKAWVTNMEKWLKYKKIIAYNENYKTESRAIKTEELLNAISKEMTQDIFGG